MARNKAHLFQRNGWWWCYVGGTKRSLKTKDRKEAAARAKRLRRAYEDPVYKAATEATVGELAAVMLQEVERRGRAEHTLRYYSSKLGQIVRGLGADMPLSDMEPERISSYIDQRRSEDASQHTISKELGALRHLLRIAKRRGQYGGEIEDLFPLGFGSGYEPRRRSLTLDEVRLLLEQLPERWRGWVAFAIATGARKSEVERAEKEDISEDFRIVQVRGTKTETSDDAVAVPDLFRPLLILAVSVGAEEGPMFGVWSNSVLALSRACRRAGIQAVTPNDLRRTHATLLRAGGVPVDVVARQLRHADSRMVQRVYGRLGAEQVLKLLPAAPEIHQRSGEPAESIRGQSGDDPERTFSWRTLRFRRVSWLRFMRTP